MATPYDEFAYPGCFQMAAHPDRLAVMARLFGMEPPPVERCRVLELGCGDGGHLVTIAFGLPESEFLGIDLSPTAIARGRASIAALQLQNIQLHTMDLMNFSPDSGLFDYIIVHGLYSWVSPEARAQILRICRNHLGRNGVSYISYNTQPGWHLRQVACDLMRFHIDGCDLGVKPREARAVLGDLCAALPGDSPYAKVLRAELDRIAEKPDGPLLHDELAQTNEPTTISRFLAQASEHQLQYLSDAEYADTVDRCLQRPTADLLGKYAGDDTVRREQYGDFLVGRCFRRTLLCHADCHLKRPAGSDRLWGVRIACAVRPGAGTPSGMAAGTEQFVTPRGATLFTNQPLEKYALRQLAAVWPQSLPFEELLAGAANQTSIGAGRNQSELAAALGEFLLTAVAARVVNLHCHAPSFARTVSERPLASALARWQATQGDTVNTLTNTSVRLEGALARNLLLLLDGTRDRAAVLKELQVLLERGEVTLREGGVPLTVARGKELLAEGLEEHLQKLAHLALLAR